MVTKLSTKGQVVLPGPVRRRLALEPGDSLEIKIKGETIQLVPQRKKVRRGRIVKDPITGLPVLTAGPNAPKLTQEEIKQMLAEFP